MCGRLCAIRVRETKKPKKNLATNRKYLWLLKNLKIF